MIDYKKELESFAYIVSHDLNAPLRHIKAFGTLLFDSLGDKVSDEERVYLQHMQKGVTQAETMIEALLSYSRIGAIGEPDCDLDTCELVNDVLKDFAVIIKDTNARISVSNLPVSLKT